MARYPLWGGALLALPITMKLYVGALLLWLVVYRPRAALACFGSLALFWLVLPAALFGLEGSVQLYLDWLHQLTIINGRWVYDLPPGLGPPLISLRRAASSIAGADPYAPTAVAALYAMQAAWIGLLSIYAWRAWQIGSFELRSRAALADWIILLLAPLPMSPWFEPYHAVPIVMAIALGLIVGFDENSRQRDRTISFATLAAVFVIQFTVTSFAIRGLVFTLQFAMLTLAFAAMRPALIAARSEARMVSCRADQITI